MAGEEVPAAAASAKGMDVVAVTAGVAESRCPKPAKTLGVAVERPALVPWAVRFCCFLREESWCVTHYTVNWRNWRHCAQSSRIRQNLSRSRNRSIADSCWEDSPFHRIEVLRGVGGRGANLSMQSFCMWGVGYART